MFLSRQTTDKNIDMGLCYSILQKCVRRCLLNEAIYYGKLIYLDGTPNALRKRLIQYCLEDMSRLDLALEILDVPDNKLFDYLQIITKNKKSRISEWYLSVCSDHFKYKTKDIDKEVEEGIKIFALEKKSKFKEIRDFLGKDLSKLYSYMKKDKLVWAMKILWENRPELNYDLDRDIDKNIKARKFDEIPKYVLDKHVLNGTPGLKFFFENGAIIFNKVYENEPYEFEAKNIYFHNEKQIKDDRSTPAELHQNRFRNVKRVGAKSFLASNFLTNKRYFIKEIDNDKKEGILFSEKIKKMINFPDLNIELRELEVPKQKDKYKLWLLSDIVESNFCFEDFFGNYRNMMYDQKKLILATLFKSLIGSRSFSSDCYLFDWNSSSPVFSVNDSSCLGEFSKRTYGIHIIPPRCIDDVEKSWENYFKTFRKNDIVNELNKWKKNIKLSEDFEFKETLLKRIKKIKKEIDII